MEQFLRTYYTNLNPNASEEEILAFLESQGFGGMTDQTVTGGIMNVPNIIEDSGSESGGINRNTGKGVGSLSDIIDFIKYAISEDITGTFDFVSSTNVSLEEVETYFNRNVAFGDFCYTTPSLSNKKLIKLFNQADKTSMEVVNKFLDILND